MKKLICILLLSLLMQGWLNQAYAVNSAQLIEIETWSVPWQGRPRDPFVDSSGLVWFCGQQGNYLANFSPSTGKFNHLALPTGAHPHNLLVDAKGQVWYAGNKNATIGKIATDSAVVTEYPMPEEIKDPHTLVLNQQGDIWFTAQHSNAIGLFSTQNGSVKYVLAKTNRARPYGIKMDNYNQPWSVLLGTNKLAKVDPNSLQLTEITLPRKDARPRRLEITEDNHIWYVDYAEGYLGEYDPNKKTFKEWPMPGGNNSMPYGTSLDNQDRIWIAETGQYPNKIVGFDTKNKTFMHSTIVESGGSIRHMYFDPKQQAVWFGLDSGFIGRLKINDVSM